MCPQSHSPERLRLGSQPSAGSHHAELPARGTRSPIPWCANLDQELALSSGGGLGTRALVLFVGRLSLARRPLTLIGASIKTN